MFEDGRRFMVPRAGLVESPPTELPLDPYVLGAWLGDGSTGGCNITIGNEDEAAMSALMAEAGAPVRRVGARVDVGRYTFSSNAGFGANQGTPVARALRKMPCFRDKHVPDAYLGSGTEQRLALLQGLMDTDGCMSRQGSAIFVGTKALADAVFALAASLGQLPHLNFQADERSRTGGHWRVHFTPEGIVPFRLPRKVGLVPEREPRKWVSVSSVEEVESVPVRCISVDAEDSLFQVGDGIVTHNTHHWIVSNKGHKMYETVDGNATKGNNRFLAITNAYLPGEDSVAERMRDKYVDFLEGRAENTRQLYDTLEAHPKTPLTGPLTARVLERVRGDAIWSPIQAILLSIVDKQIGPARSRRMWLNQVVAEDDAVHGPETWLPLRDESLELLDGEEIVLGFDGGKSDDATALVAIRCFDSAVFVLGLWEKPEIARGPEDERWEVDRIAVDAEVHRALAAYRVKAFYADVALWESYIDAWATEFGDGFSVKATERHAVAWDMRSSLKRSTMAHERLVSAIFDRKLRHNGDRRLQRHVLNAKRRVNNFGLNFGKESRESPRKVDLYAAMMLAHEALTDFRLRGKTEKVRTRRGYFL